MFVLGVDGGGTKTKAALFLSGSGICWTWETEATNPHSMGFLQSVQTVISIIEKACLDLDLTEKNDLYISLGVAGLGRKVEQRKWLDLFHKHVPQQLPIKEIAIENDGKIALYAGTFGMDGIVSIAGTGALTFGVKEDTHVRVGGWGHLVGGDPGSGYYIGLKVLEAVFNQEDGIGKKTRLTDLLLEKENVKNVKELIPILYQNKEKQQVAAIAPLVFEAAHRGDVIATSIIRQTANHISRNGTHVYETLFKEEEEVPFVLAGGLFQNVRMVQEVKMALKNVAPITLLVTRDSPVIGSIVIVLKRIGYTTAEIQQQLGSTEEGGR